MKTSKIFSLLFNNHLFQVGINQLNQIVKTLVASSYKVQSHFFWFSFYKLIILSKLFEIWGLYIFILLGNFSLCIKLLLYCVCSKNGKVANKLKKKIQEEKILPPKKKVYLKSLRGPCIFFNIHSSYEKGLV